MKKILLSAPHLGGDELGLVQDVFASNWIAPTGPMVDLFEQRLVELSGFQHVAALSSGTAALHLALTLCGVGPHDEVWGSTMTFIGGVAPINYLNATPVFFDISSDDLLIDLDLLEESLRARAKTGELPKVIITTDLYGLMPNMERMARLKEEYGFLWISDSAESVGAYRAGRHAGKGADFAFYSFNGNKIITTSGGGALASDNFEAIERARFLSTQARDPAPHYEHTTFGYNYRLSNVCAAIGVGQLRMLDERVKQRRRIHEDYRRMLSGLPGISFSVEAPELQSNRWLTTILIDPNKAGFDREAVRRVLEANDIESRPLWKPMHLQPVYSTAQSVGGCVAARCFATGLCLPSGSQMTFDDVARVSALIQGMVR